MLSITLFFVCAGYFDSIKMDSFFKSEDCLPSQMDILKCPFLRNIKEPTNFSLASAMPFAMPVSFLLVICINVSSSFFLFFPFTKMQIVNCFPGQVRGAKGPIFEDGPNFDMAFRLFHGRDGVVPLSGRSFSHLEKLETKPAPPQFNPLAAKAATISLSSFGPGGPFSFDAFSEKWKNQKKKSNSCKKDSSSQVHQCQCRVLWVFSAGKLYIASFSASARSIALCCD